MFRLFTLKNIVILLTAILIVSGGVFIYWIFSQQQHSVPLRNFAAPTPLPTSSSLFPSPSLSPSPLPSPSSPSPSSSSPLSSLPLSLVIPPGFKIPENTSAQYPTSLVPILPSLIPDSETKKLSIPAKDLLFYQLSKSFIYQPASSEIVEDTSYQVLPTIIDFGHFDPESTQSRPGNNLLWFNQNTLSCQLKTDPKSPTRIDRTIGSQETLILQLFTPGIYLFFCQGIPGSTQTIVVS